MLGNGRLQVQSFDGKVRLGHIRGKLKKKVWISAGDVVLIGLRDFQDSKCDVIMKYLPEEVKALKNYKEIPEDIKIDETQGGNTGIVFTDESDEDKDGVKKKRRK